jgi:hypothetical protein
MTGLPHDDNDGEGPRAIVVRWALFASSLGAVRTTESIRSVVAIANIYDSKGDAQNMVCTL